MTKLTKLIFSITVLVIVLFAAAPITAFAVDNPLKITVKQVFTTLSSSANDTFTYRLKPAAASCPMPAGCPQDGYTFSITGTDSHEIGPISYSQTGVFTYELLQVVAAEAPGYSYDRSVYTIEAYVDAQLGVELVMRNPDNTKTAAIEFINGFDYQPSGIIVDPPVRKTVSGAPSTNSVFTFTLTAQNPANPMPAGSVNGVKTLSITGAGEGEFGTWSYDREGVYYYTISEVNSGIAGYTYDTTVYTITDIVSVVGGRLEVSRVVTNNLNMPVTVCDYTNIYSSGSFPATGNTSTGNTSGGNTSSGNTSGGNTSGGGNGGGGGGYSWSYLSPRTGDYMNTGFFTTLLVLSLAVGIGATICFVVGTRRQKNPLQKG